MISQGATFFGGGGALVILAEKGGGKGFAPWGLQFASLSCKILSNRLKRGFLNMPNCRTTTASLFFFGWARFMGTGYFAMEKKQG